MTREEARDQIVIFMCDEQKVINNRDKQALEMAIQALEQSSGDLINRAEAIKAIDEKAKRIKNEDTLNGLAGAVAILFDLPSYNSINSELSDDAVSRQAVLDLLEDTNNGWIINEVSQLPSVNPQPCEDAISRQALLDAFGFSEKTRKWGGDHSGYNTMMLYEIQDIIESQPSVKPQEKTGHWQHYEGMLICSECGTEFYDDIMEYCGDDVPKCCPDCGCRMVGPQERSE